MIVTGAAIIIGAWITKTSNSVGDLDEMVNSCYRNDNALRMREAHSRANADGSAHRGDQLDRKHYAGREL